jgi:glutathione S-transferase P
LQTASKSPPRITYFDFRGRVEMIRLTFEELEIIYEDRRIRTPKEWADLRPQVPLGQLPIYEDGDLLLAESHAIIRHLARKHDLYGKDEKERARCDMVEECLYAAQETLWRHFWDPQFEAKRKPFATERIAPVLARLEALLSESDSSHFVRSGLTYVDLYAFVYLDQLRALFPETLASVPRINDFRTSIARWPRVRDYLASDRRPTGFGMGIRGLIQDPEARGPAAITPWDDQYST